MCFSVRCFRWNGPLDELALFFPATSCTGPRSHSALTGADLLSRGARGGLDQSSSYLVSLHTCAALCHVHTGGPPGHLCVCQCWGPAWAPVRLSTLEPPPGLVCVEPAARACGSHGHPVPSSHSLPDPPGAYFPFRERT